ncbi:MAG: hypothetical protein V3571_14150 [Pseudodesulfovibrio sp.]
MSIASTQCAPLALRREWVKTFATRGKRIDGRVDSAKQGSTFVRGDGLTAELGIEFTPFSAGKLMGSVLHFVMVIALLDFSITI